MAWLVGDGFDFYNDASVIALNSQIWQRATFCVLDTSGTRFNYGNSVLLGNTSAVIGNLTTQPFANSNVIFVNMNILTHQPHVNGGTQQTVGFVLMDGTNVQCGFYLRNGGDFVVTSNSTTSGGANGTVIATSPTVLMPLADVWTHIQVKIVVHNTAGSVELRIDGNPTSNWTATGLNTRNGSANAYANVINITATSTNSDHCDDFYAFNDQGIQPNTFQGSARAIQQFPTSDNSVTWTRSAGPSNCLLVDDPRQDGDATYVATGVVNNVDTYGMGILSPTPASIIAVCPRYLARMEEAGPHQITAQLTSGATTVSFSNFTLTGTYAYRTVAYPQDPNTSAAWTPVAVNNILLSIKDVL